MNRYYSILILVYVSLNINLSLGGDTISWNESVSSGQRIISSGGNFELGFFRPGDSDRSYYIGIWYKKLYPQTVVWVANRDKPLDDANGNLVISQGNLVLFDKLGNRVWSALETNNISSRNNNTSVTAVLRDDGNLILSDVSISLTLWQSFDYPTHIFLPGAKLGYDKRTKRKQVLVSWKDSSDPAPGLYSMEIDPENAQFVMKWNRTKEYWASGSWDGEIFSSIPEWTSKYIFNYSYIDNENESYFTYSLYNSSTITSSLSMDVSGQIMRRTWLDSNIDWNLLWSQPRQDCEVYAKCGAFGVCNNVNSTCSCLSGFKARSDREWNSDDYSGGCVRDHKVQCDAVTEDNDSLWMNSVITLPDSRDTNITISEASQCRAACFNDCSCTAYAYDGSGTCSIWTGDVFNLQRQSKSETARTIFVKRGSPDDG